MNGDGTGVWLAIGWTMVHFVWVGGLIGVAAAIASRALRGASAEVRYGVALASLAMLALAPAAIAWRVGVAGGADRPLPEPVTQEAPVIPPSFVRQVEEAPAPIVRTETDGAATPSAIGRAAAAPRPANLASRLDALAARLPWLWLAGSPITFTWLALGLAGAERLRRRSAMAADGELPGLCRRLAGELGIARGVAVAVCDRLAAPVLVGVVRPLILLPAAAMGGWAPDQLEMVLLHELAHVRRWDNLVNLLQRLVESALFFHPAVWVVSGWVRREREHCCDGVVVAHTGRARDYAETLLSLADPSPDRTPHAAVALAGNDLVARVRRILDLHPEGHAMKLPRGLLALTAAILIFPAGWTISRARLAAPPGDAQAKPATEATDPEIDLRALVARANDLTEAAANSRKNPNERVRALLDLGTSKAQGGDRAGGVAVLHKAAESIKRMEEGRDRVSATKMLAERLALAGEADEAIALASSLEENAEGMDMVRSGALNTIAFYLAFDGNDAKAIEAARGIRHQSLLPSALGMIAEVQARQGDTAAAMRTVESIEPAEARIRALVGTSSERDHPGLAVARGRAGDRDGARECLDRARALAAILPDGAGREEARSSIALAVAQIGDIAEGLRQIRALDQSETRDTAIGQIALLQAQSDDWAGAYRIARSVPDPEHRFFAIFQLGEAQNGAGKRDDARQTFRKLLEANAGPKPLTTDVHSITRAQIYAGDLTAALATIERMEVPDTQLIEQVAAVQAEAGDFSGARMTVAERIPDDAEKAGAYGAIAYYQAKAGQAKEALRWAESLDHRRHRSAVLMGVAMGVAERRGVPLDQLQAPPKKAEAGEKDESQPAKAVADRPASIQGKTIDEWLAALKDRDPAVRERAVEVLGERSLDPALPAAEKSRLQIALNTLMSSDRDQGVRQSAAFFAELQLMAHSPERLKRALEARRRVVKPTRVAIRLVDAEGRPVEGAVASTFFQKDPDHGPSFTPSDSAGAATSDARGELALELSIAGHLDGVGVYAIRPDGNGPIVGLHKVTREQIREGKPVTVVMHPACRVRFRVECPGLREVAEKYHADLGGETWWRSAYVWLGETHEAPRPLLTSSTSGELEFLLPPGRYMIMAYGADVNSTDRPIEVKPGHRLLSLGVVELSPSNAVKKGIFRGYWRSIRRDPRADAKGGADDERIAFRRPRHGTGPKGEARGTQDVAYSPDGKLLATAHWHDDPGDVKLWDAKTSELVASLPVPTREGGVLNLAFSPDGKVLAGSVGELPNPKPPGVIVLWDVAGHRELRILRGHGARIAALAFSPDGRTLASGGEDRSVRFWDVTSGREVGRIDGNHGWVRSAAYSPDGKVLAIGSGRTLKLWDVAGNRPGATLEPEGFWIQSVAFTPDGKTLAAAGTVVGPGNQGGVGRVRLYDLTQSPPARRAELSLHDQGPNNHNDFVSDVAFTPDGRRVVGIMMQTIVIWDAATGAETDSLDRGSGSSADRLAVSPDGRWLAVKSLAWGGVSIFDVGPPGP